MNINLVPIPSLESQDLKYIAQQNQIYKFTIPEGRKNYTNKHAKIWLSEKLEV